MKFWQSLRKYLCCWPTRGKCFHVSDKTAKLLEKSWCFSHMRGSSYSFDEYDDDDEDTVGPQRDKDTLLLDRIEAKCNEYRDKKRLASVAKGLLAEMESQLATDKRDITAVLEDDVKRLCGLCHDGERADGQPNEQNVSVDTVLNIGSVFSVLDGECRACLVASKTQKLRNDLYRLGCELRLVLDTINTMEERLVCIEQELLERPRIASSSFNSSTYLIETPRSILVLSDYDDDLGDSQYTYTCSTVDSRSSVCSTTTIGSLSIVFMD